jgi:hypothetical protein
MNDQFREAVESLHPKFERLIGGDPYTKGATLPKQGVYLFCENGLPLYVGRSNNIPQRYQNHTGLGSGTNQAALAALIARRETRRPVDYRKGAKQRMLADEKFMNAFRQAQHRVRVMKFQAVEEFDQTRQTLLEVYCAITLKTPYNDFGTH